MNSQLANNLNLHLWMLLCLIGISSPCIAMEGKYMPYANPDRLAGSDRLPVESSVRREAPVDAHMGTLDDFACRLADAAHEAATDRSMRDAYLEQLPEVATDERNLMAAFNYLEAHGGQAAGVDGITYRDIPAGYRWQYVRQLRDALRSGDYRPAPLRKVRIPKGPGRGMRTLQLPSITDRVIGRAVAQAVEPYLDAEFEPTTFGYRSGADRSRLHALATAEALAIQGNAWWWLTADIRNAFGSIPRNRLLDVLQQRLTPSSVTREEFKPELIQLISRLAVNGTRRGIPMGQPLGPLLLNLYLDHFLDKPWESRKPAVPVLRYADDLLVICRSQQEAFEAFTALESLLRPAAMQLKESFEHAYCHLATGGKAEWLGLAISRPGREQAIRCSLSQISLWKLGEAIRLAAGKPDNSQRIQSAIRGWIYQMGPAYLHTRLREIAAFIGSVANRYGVPLPLRREIRDCWREAHEQWLGIRAATGAGGEDLGTAR